MFAVLDQIVDSDDVRMHILLAKLKLIFEQLPVSVVRHLRLLHYLHSAGHLRLYVYTNEDLSVTSLAKFVKDLVLFAEILGHSLPHMRFEREEVLLLLYTLLP